MNLRLFTAGIVAAVSRSSADSPGFVDGNFTMIRARQSRGVFWRRGAWWAAALLFAVTASGCGLRRPEPGNDWASVKRTIRERFPEVRQITTSELDALLYAQAAKRPVLVDVRSHEEYEVSHLLDAIRAETEDEALEALALEPLDRPIVVYCSVGYRSSELAEALAEAGYTDVANLEGSLFAWANEGRPVYDDKGPVRVVHPYDETWGRLLERSLWPVTFVQVAPGAKGVPE